MPIRTNTLAETLAIRHLYCLQKSYFVLICMPKQNIICPRINGGNTINTRVQGLSRIPSKDAGEGRAQQVRRFHVWPREQTQRPVPGDAREDRVIYLAQVLEKKNAGYFATYNMRKTLYSSEAHSYSWQTFRY